MVGKFTPAGKRVGTTLVAMMPTTIEGARTQDKHGYTAARLKIADLRSKKNKTIYREVRTGETHEIGSEVKLSEILAAGDEVQVTGISKGKGFAGAVKRYGFKGGPRTHGQSDRERAPGSSGSGTTPGRVYKGKRRAGHMGNVTVTVAGIKVLEVDAEKGLITLIGSVPGNRNGLIKIAKV